MALKYTGMADPFVYGGKAYRPGDTVPISKEMARHHADASKLHTFEDAEGEPLEATPGVSFAASPVTGAPPAPAPDQK